VNRHVTTVLDFLVAAQTITAVYGSPDGPTDPERYYEAMSSLLDDIALLNAQAALAALPPNHLYVVMPEQNAPLKVVPALN
jgi:hypothetical protein